jgi:hypothetical protein
MTNQIRTQDETGTAGTPGRRALLRTGGAVVAGMAGLAVTETALAGSASAVAGDPVVMGAANDAQATTTTLTSANAAGSTFALAHTADLAPLRVVEQVPPSQVPDALDSGDLVNYGGDLYYTAGGTGGPFFGFVYTGWTANQLVPITPQRVLDTRNANGRANILNPAGNLDSSGRLLGGHTIEIDLSGLAQFSTAAYCNLTAVTPVGGGYMVLWPGGARPGTSTINFAAKAVIANFAVTGVSANDSVMIFANIATHVLLDVTSFATGFPGDVSAPGPAAAAVSPAQRRAERVKNGTLPRSAARR